ncbi:hypothetical protein [Acetivibrio clariflavus]|nr:hypothetical protein [Acetivibrio clariflavus]HOQ00526.1 hypothetical protein [Acetivibrio clariflavus]HPU41436.1 hypothetical protein [Acetivibrio clariflavus]
MKILRILLTLVLTVNIFSAAAFAVPTEPKTTNPINTEQNNKNSEKGMHHEEKKCKDKKCKDECIDPIKSLKEKKEAILKLEKEGKISKEKAEKKIKEIDSRIKEFEEFNKLSVEQKRAKLIEKFKGVMAEKVKEGKISQEKADELINEYTKKVQEWDGKGIPRFYHKSRDKKIKDR